MASKSGVFVGAGVALLFTSLQSAMFLLAMGGVSTAVFLLVFRRPRVGASGTR